MKPNSIHERTLHALTLHLDGRLGPEGKALARRHLAACPPCGEEWARLRALHRLGRTLPSPGTAPDLARRAREAARRPEPRPGPERVVGPRAAAAALVLAALGVGWGLGRWTAPAHPAPTVEHAAARTPEPEGTAAAPTADREPRRGRVEPLVPIHDDAQARRAARGVLADLASLDRIPPDLRRPLLRTQLTHFDLAPWAARRLARPADDDPALHRVAALLRRLDLALASPHETATLEALHREVLDPALWAAVERQPSAESPPAAPSPAVWREVAGAAADLDPAERETLGTVLALKARWLTGSDVADVRRFVREIGTPAERGGPLLRITLATVLSDLGLPDLASPMLDDEGDAKDGVRGLILGVSLGGDLPIEGPGGDGAALLEAIERHLGRLPRSAEEREVLIEDAPDGSSRALRITIKRKVVGTGAGSEDPAGDGPP